MNETVDKVIGSIDLSQNKPLNEIVYEGIRSAIIKGLIPVGERINEKEYASRMNISRTPIRDSLRRVEKEGLVEYIPRYGVVVKKISVANAEEIYQIRKSLDVLATKNAMKLMKEEDFNEMERLLKETDQANEQNDINKVVHYFSEFNEMIYRFSQMPLLESIVLRLREYLMRFRDISLSGEQRRQKALDEHWLIFNMMKSQQYEEIVPVIEEHLDYSKKFVIAEMIRIQEESKDVPSERK